MNLMQPLYSFKPSGFYSTQNNSNKNYFMHNSFSHTNNLDLFVKNPTSKQINFGKNVKNDNFQLILENHFDNYLKTKKQDDLVLFLYDDLYSVAANKKIHSSLIDEVVQNRITDIMGMLKSSCDKQEFIDFATNMHKFLRPTKDDYVTPPKTSSLNVQIYQNSSRQYIDNLTRDSLPIPASELNQSEKDKLNAKLMSKAKDANLSDTELRYMLENENGVSYKKLGKKENLGETTIRLKIVSTKFKVKAKYNIFSTGEKRFISNLQQNLMPSSSEQDVVNYIIKNPIITSVNFKKVENTMVALNKAFEKQGFSSEKFIQVALREPNLLFLNPDIIENNVKEVVKQFEKDGLSVGQYLQAAYKQPCLFCQAPSTIENNIRTLMDKLKSNGVSTDKFVTKVALKCPNLFYQSPETLEKNLKEVTKRFEKEGLNFKLYVENAAMKQPALFYQSPDTIEKNIRELIKKFDKEGLTVETYLNKVVKKYPQLYSQTPTTTEFHIREVVNKFSEYGLTITKYLKTALKQPPLFIQNPNTIINNILNVVKNSGLEGISVKSYLAAALKNPALFCMSPVTVINKIKLYQFIENVRNKVLNTPYQSKEDEVASILRKSLISSNDRIFANFLSFLIGKDTNTNKMINSDIVNKIKNYIAANPDKQYYTKLFDKYIVNLKLDKNEVAQEFKKFITTIEKMA